MDYPSAKLLSLLAVAFIHMFATAVLQNGRLEPRWVLFYFMTIAFYGALYFRRRLCLRQHRRDGGFYRGLGYAAVVLGASLSVLFFNSVDPSCMALSLAVGVWLVAAIAAYFFYLVIVLHLEVEEEVSRDGTTLRAPV